MEKASLSADSLHHRSNGGCAHHASNGTTKHGYSHDETSNHTENKAHPLLRGGQPPHAHSFSHIQMEVLKSICDTIFPSLPPPPDETANDLQSYYELSSSDWQVPEYAAGSMSRLLKRHELRLISFILFLLSTRLGTFILCGINSFVKGFPFLEAFPSLPLEKRERIMRMWATSPLVALQLIFKVLKGAVGWNWFARADSSGYNPTWKAIGYYLPDRAGSNHQKKPLEGKVINVKEEEALCDRLRGFGFWAHEGESDMQGMSTKKKKGNKSKKGRHVTVQCDVVVVGSGSGGGVVAGVLAKAGFKVLIIEKGDYFARDDYSHIEASSAMAMVEGPNCLATEDGSILIKAGSTVGGGSAINWSASLRTPEHVLREWADDLKLGLFKEEKYQQAMDAVCDRMKVGVGFKKESLQNRMLREGCVKLGYHVEDVPCNAVGEHYCGWCEYGCSSGAKQSTAETWLVDAVAGGALILAGCRVEEVFHRRGERKKRRAAGLVAEILNGKLYVHARAVVVAGGALQTPLLLRRSGLCNGEIGRNLHLHPSILAWGYVPPRSAGGDEAEDEGRAFEGSIITACSREVAGENHSSGYGALLQCPSVMPGAFSFIVPWTSGAGFKRTMQRYCRTCLIFTLTRDRTCGTVTENGAGSVRIDYRLSPTDAAIGLDALQLAVRVLAAAPGVAEVGTMSVDADSCHPADVDAYLARIRSRGMHGLNFSMQSAHQMGTCRMGVDPSFSAVDPSCETWEVEGLFVGDTSVFPTAIGVNPMVTVQAIAFCTAHNILRFLRSSAAGGECL